jgi:peptide/nickel transport system ATP-binding protein
MPTSLAIDVKNLKTYFSVNAHLTKAVDGVSISIPEGKTLSLVGESGCGKSVTALSIMRLLPSNGIIVDGEILFDGLDLANISKREMTNIRGNKISMIFQNPMLSLNPVFTAGNQIMEAILLHRDVSKREAKEIALDMLAKVSIPEPKQRFNEYPHQMSGGMQQRIMIVMALVCHPKLLIADEPTTALDVTTQAQILDLMVDLQNEMGTSILFISHDLGVVAEISDHVAVMYSSRIVEYAEVKELYSNPKHPYTVALFDCRPRLGVGREEKLRAIPGSVPESPDSIKGCKFNPRCQYAMEKCRTIDPLLIETTKGHQVACLKYE